MVQSTIAYLALGLGVLLTTVGAFGLTTPRAGRLLSPHRRLLIIGGVFGMAVFLAAMLPWMRGALWIP